MQLLKSIPGVGDILAIVIGTEIGLIERFGSAEQLASYAGTVPAVKSSGGKVAVAARPRRRTIISNGLSSKLPTLLLNMDRSLTGNTGM
jgi:transposase